MSRSRTAGAAAARVTATGATASRIVGTAFRYDLARPPHRQQPEGNRHQGEQTSHHDDDRKGGDAVSDVRRCSQRTIALPGDGDDGGHERHPRTRTERDSRAVSHPDHETKPYSARPPPTTTSYGTRERAMKVDRSTLV